MMVSFFPFVFFASILFSLTTGEEVTGCYKPLKGPLPSVITSPLPQHYIKTSDLPDNFDWRNHNGMSYVTPPTNQFLPSFCGSCWAHAAVGALTDRFIIANKGQTSFPLLSPQVLLDCGDDTEMGSCHGGNDFLAYRFIHENGITDVTCSPYLGVSQTNWGERGTCAERMCRQCDSYGVCEFVNGTIYHVSEYGTITGESAMMAEVYARGPIACSLYAHAKSFLYYKNGIITEPTQYNITTHVITITGWGEDNGVKYWIGRNSFGTVWGEQGWFKLERGKNTLDIEKHPCAWAVPKL